LPPLFFYARGHPRRQRVHPTKQNGNAPRWAQVARARQPGPGRTDMKNQPELSRRLVILGRLAGAVALAFCLSATLRAQNQGQQSQSQDQSQQGQQAQSQDQGQPPAPQAQSPDQAPAPQQPAADQPSSPNTLRRTPTGRLIPTTARAAMFLRLHISSRKALLRNRQPLTRRKHPRLRNCLPP